MKPLISGHKLIKTYPLGDCRVNALQGVDVEIMPGEFCVLLGPSGSGKSSLMHILGVMDRPTQGRVEMDGRDLFSLSARQRANLRLRKIGFIFQTFNLIPTFSALENVALPMRLAGVNKKDRLARAAALLERVGLAERARHLPKQLSGGERQRVAIARALANDPSLILADEPTGNLDSAAGQAVMDLLTALHHEGRTVLMVTHNADLAAHAQRVLRMRDGWLETTAG